MILSSFSKESFFGVFSFLGLFIPVIAFVHFGFIVLWLTTKKKWRALYSVLSIVFIYYAFGLFFRPFSGPGEETISIMSFNARGFNRYDWMADEKGGDRISKFLNKKFPDILCIQEHTRIRYKQLKSYKYRAETPYGSDKSTQAIFTKYPIVNKGSLDFPGTINNVIFADIVIQMDTVRVYNVHLQSYVVDPNGDVLEKGKYKSTLKKIWYAVGKQHEQAYLLKNHIKTSGIRKILICGDFNTTQFSNIYRTIKGNLQDSFLEAGSGFGKTFDLYGFPMRIDYILADDNFEITSHKNYDIQLSDHYPVMATVKFRE
ncbi:endonuclease/exonuclease/phosphatase family protein [Flavobacterium sp. ASW18X]|uniref:endonuclease/exonuclease/phosphatase family protein n=1 Tax=Flavobacterium sp. ASW18X TaxID=2572595 RepID=UPI00146D8C5E|nr:endonuclease/exonuclease/phosphatase family protein [Flavobacterium sp. ASW18X]